MLTIPYAGHAGASEDRVYRGRLPTVAPTTVLDSSHLAPFGKVYRGNAAVDGSITWSDVTAAANGAAPGVTIFDSAAPHNDRLCVEVAATDVLTGIGLLIDQAAVLTGTVVAEVFHRTATGWATLSGVVTPVLTAPGLAVVEFALSGALVALTDDEIDPPGQPAHRCAYLRFTGITGVTTPLVCSRVYKRLSHSGEHSAQDITTVVGQGANPDFSTRQTTILPVEDDLLAFGFDERPLQLLATVYRPSGVPAAQKEWVYSRTDDFAALPVAALDDPTAELTAPLAAGAAVSFVPAGWNGSDSGADTNPKALAPTVPAGQQLDIASLARIAISGVTLFGTFIVDPNLAATAVEYTGGNAALRGSNLRTWYLWAQDGTVTKLVRLRFQMSGSTLQYLADAWFRTVTGSTVDFTQENVGATGTVWSNGPFAETNAVAGYGIDGITGTIQPSVLAMLRIALAPPADLAKRSVMGAGGTSHLRYWIGLRQIADSAAAVLPENITLRALTAKGAGAQGVPADQAAYTQCTLVRHPAPAADAVLTVANVSTGRVASVTLPAGDTTAVAAIDLGGGAVGDPLVTLRTRGPELDDHVVYLS